MAGFRQVYERAYALDFVEYLDFVKQELRAGFLYVC